MSKHAVTERSEALRSLLPSPLIVQYQFNSYRELERALAQTKLSIPVA